MEFKTIKSIIDLFSGYSNDGQIIKVVIDLLICLVIMAFFFVFMYRLKKVNRKWLIISVASFLVLLAIAVVLDLYYLQNFYKYILFLYIFLWGTYYTPEIRDYFKEITQARNTKNLIETAEERDRLIDILAVTCEHLSERQIGAIITIERQDSLNTYIEKGTFMNSEVSKELLDTIFMPGTDLHDGAVIIRGNKIMCAGAFYPTSKNADIPKTYGSRHRAALGISENSDAFTIVVSEETGHISCTLDTTLTPNISIETLRHMLKQNIIIK